MRLQHYTENYYCEYNPDKCDIDENSIEYIDYSRPFEERMNTATDLGYCVQMPFGWVAVYASGNDIILQIDKQKWTLGKGDVQTTYIYNFTNDKVVFSVNGPQQNLDVSYDKSWKDGVNDLVDPVYAGEDSNYIDNDLLAFVNELNQDDEILANVLRSWQENGAR